MANPQIRFDSLDPRSGPRSICFAGALDEVEAWKPEDVAAALREIDRAVRHGVHAGGFICYEAASAMDPALAAHPPRPDLPLLWFGLFSRRLEGAPLEGLDEGEYELGPLHSSLTETDYAGRVARILELIAAGDTYQVNLTFPLRAEFGGSPAALYRDLCLAQRSGFCSLITWHGHSILSASPELFFRRKGDRIELRPMKGTHPRGRWWEEDEAFASALAASAKDRAENLMIVDLLRNDLGRVARFGSVAVSELFHVERYPTVLQMTSSIEGRVDAEVELAQVVRALFPCGSITGAPKVRTSEIITELEDGPRGIYTGAIGMVSPDLTSFSVAIRTAVVDRQAGALSLGVGSGITADSEAATEYAECLRKGAFLQHRQPDFQLLETMRFDRALGCDLLDEHLRRLSRSAEYFGYPVDLEALRRRIGEYAGALPNGTHKVRLLLDGSGRAELMSEPIPETLPPARIVFSEEQVDERDPFLYHKTTRRDRYIRALAGHPDADDVLLRNRRGEVTEACNANIVIELERLLLTPPVEAGILPGVMRSVWLREGRIHERVIWPEDVRRASAIYLINAVRRWRVASLVEKEGF